MLFIYADTSVWNAFCDQKVDPLNLRTELAKRGAVLTLGFNNFYEMAKPFFGTADRVARGRELLTYMRQFLTLEFPMLRENCVLLIEEALHVNGQQQMKSCFRDEEQYLLAVREIDKLFAGEVGTEAKQFFESRKAAARSSRDTMKERLAQRPDVREVIRKVNSEELPNFLDRSCMAPLGQSLLSSHLGVEFPKNSQAELSYTAKLLLESRAFRLSRAMTRADIYLIWRCSTRGSLRSDLPDDTFHAVNAAYADVFLTTEADQSSIASYVIEGVETVVFSHGEGASDRLLTELDRIPSVASAS